VSCEATRDITLGRCLTEYRVVELGQEVRERTAVRFHPRASRTRPIVDVQHLMGVRAGRQLAVDGDAPRSKLLFPLTPRLVVPCPH